MENTSLSFQSEPQVFSKVLPKTLTEVPPGAGIPLPRHIVVYCLTWHLSQSDLSMNFFANIQSFFLICHHLWRFCCPAPNRTGIPGAKNLCISLYTTRQCIANIQKLFQFIANIVPAKNFFHNRGSRIVRPHVAASHKYHHSPIHLYQ